MSGLDIALQKAASSALSRFGKPITIRYHAAGSYDTSTGTVPVTDTDVTVQARLEPATRVAFQHPPIGEDEPGGVQTRDWKCTVAGPDLPAGLTNEATVFIDGQELEIYGVTPVFGVEEVVYYEFFARR